MVVIGRKGWERAGKADRQEYERNSTNAAQHARPGKSPRKMIRCLAPRSQRNGPITPLAATRVATMPREKTQVHKTVVHARSN